MKEVSKARTRVEAVELGLKLGINIRIKSDQIWFRK